MPMHLRFWSPDAPGFTSENDELEKVFGIIIAATGGRGIFIYDRGGDDIEFYRYSLEKNVDFIVRLKSRYVFSWKRKITCEELAEQCPTRYSDVITFDSHGKQIRITLHYGVIPARLPDLKGKLRKAVTAREKHNGCLAQDPRTSRLPFLRHRRWHQDAALAMREMVRIREG